MLNLNSKPINFALNPKIGELKNNLPSIINELVVEFGEQHRAKIVKAIDDFHFIMENKMEDYKNFILQLRDQYIQEVLTTLETKFKVVMTRENLKFTDFAKDKFESIFSGIAKYCEDNNLLFASNMLRDSANDYNNFVNNVKITWEKIIAIESKNSFSNKLKELITKFAEKHKYLFPINFKIEEIFINNSYSSNLFNAYFLVTDKFILCNLDKLMISDSNTPMDNAVIKNHRLVLLNLYGIPPTEESLTENIDTFLLKLNFKYIDHKTTFQGMEAIKKFQNDLNLINNEMNKFCDNINLFMSKNTVLQKAIGHPIFKELTSIYKEILYNNNSLSHVGNAKYSYDNKFFMNFIYMTFSPLKGFSDDFSLSNFDIIFIHNIIHSVTYQTNDPNSPMVIPGLSNSKTNESYYYLNEHLIHTIANNVTNRLHEKGIYLIDEKDKIKDMSIYSKNLDLTMELINHFYTELKDALINNSIDLLKVSEDKLSLYNNILNIFYHNQFIFSTSDYNDIYNYSEFVEKIKNELNNLTKEIISSKQ